MKTVPGIGMRGGGDRPVQVRCSCGGVACTLPAGERVVLPPRGEAREVRAECCGRPVQIRVEVDRG